MSTVTMRRDGRRRVKLAATLLTVGALALSACSNGADDDADTGTDTGTEADAGTDGTEEETDADEPEELTPITVVTFLPLQSFTFAPEMMAYSGGYFEEHGLDVTLEAVQGTPAAIQAVIGGAAFITRASTIDLMPPWEDGQEIVGVGTMARQTNLRIASADTNPIEAAEDLEGETLGMGSVGGTSERTLDLALREFGVDGDTVERQAVPVTAATFELVRRGELAGYIVSLDTALTLEIQNEDAVISTAGLDSIPDLQLFFTTPENVENEPETIEKFLAAMADATQFMVDDEANNYDETLRILRDSGDWDFPALFDDEASRAALTIYTTETWMDDSGVPLLHIDPELFESAYDVLTDGGLVEGTGNPQDWITTEFAP